jgi:NAD+ kinase
VTRTPDAPPRRVLVVVNTRRESVAALAVDVLRHFQDHHIETRVLAEDASALPLTARDEVDVVGSEGAAGDCELVLVIGGDGTLLRAAENAREAGTPLLGINLGHVGFLAEADPDGLEHAMQAIVEGRYHAEERLTLDVSVMRGGEVLASTWALNEASVEKGSRERMLEVEVEVDGRPLSRWGCDGVVCSTPTGSTAYNFSAGGPIVWPEVQALLIVPLSAHALFARPMVVAPTSVIEIDVLETTEASAVLWCDGRRTVDLPPGARVVVRRGHCPIHLARLTDAPFTDRLVAKFDLPVAGWRGAAEKRQGAGH